MLRTNSSIKTCCALLCYSARPRNECARQFISSEAVTHSKLPSGITTRERSRELPRRAKIACASKKSVAVSHNVKRPVVPSRLQNTNTAENKRRASPRQREEISWTASARRSGAGAAINRRSQPKIRIIGTYPDDGGNGGRYIKSNIIPLKNWRLTIQIRGIRSTAGRAPS